MVPAFFRVPFMKQTKTVKVIALSVALSTLAAVAFFAIHYVTRKPPLAEINLARETLASVKNELSGKYAVEKLTEAENLFDEAMEEWKAQNQVFFGFRDYSLVRETALKSVQTAGQAREEANSVRQKLTLNTERELNKSLKIIERFEQYYKQIPVSRSTLDLYNRGKIKYFEAQHEYERGEVKQALKINFKASENLSQAEKAAYFKLREFYNDFPEWEKNCKLAFSLSKKGQTVVLINKIESTCCLLKSGKEIKSFPAEFGPNWMGDKTMSGDRATPEGVYKIVEKKKNSRTKYYKALLLDYPNKADKARFNQMRKSGKLAKNATIGGLIEIHGEGDKGIHWTDGCIALSNKDMDVIFDQCALNTPIIIIGARQTMEEYLSE